MKLVDFKILDVVILTRSRLQTTGKLVPHQKWNFPKRLRKFGTYFHALARFGRLLFTMEIASHQKSHQNHDNQGFLRILMKSMEFKILDVVTITRSQLQTGAHFWFHARNRFFQSICESLKRNFMFCLV